MPQKDRDGGAIDQVVGDAAQKQFTQAGMRRGADYQQIGAMLPGEIDKDRGLVLAF